MTSNKKKPRERKRMRREKNQNAIKSENNENNRLDRILKEKLREQEEVLILLAEK